MLLKHSTSGNGSSEPVYMKMSFQSMYIWNITASHYPKMKSFQNFRQW